MDRRSLAIALAIALTGCQAPGFMGLNGGYPELGSERGLVPVSLKVAVPSSLLAGLVGASASSSATTSVRTSKSEITLAGVRVYPEGSPEQATLTDETGVAQLNLIAGQLTLIRAEVRTADGLFGMAVLVRAQDPDETVLIDRASTLLAERLLENFKPAQMKYLDATEVKLAEGLLRDRLGTDEWMMTASNRRTVLGRMDSSVREDAALAKAIRRLLSTPVPTPDATASATPSIKALRSAELEATPSATLSASFSVAASPSLDATASVQRGTADLWPLKKGQRWTYDLYAPTGARFGDLHRSITKVLVKQDSTLAFGDEIARWSGRDTMKLLIRKSARQVRVSASFRPTLSYSLPLRNGKSWQAAPGIRATSHFVGEYEDWQEVWRVDFSATVAGKKVQWHEWMAPEVGYVALEWVDASGLTWSARLR